MRAVVITANGGPEVLELREVPDPEPASGKLVVALEAAGVNFRDVYEREGKLAAYANTQPLIGGIEGAGTVVEGDRAGDRVCWVAAPASYAERVLVDANVAVPVPDGVSSEQAAAVLLQGMIYGEDDIIRLGGDEDNADKEDRVEDLKPHFAQAKAGRIAPGSTNPGVLVNGNGHSANMNGANEMEDGELSDDDAETFLGQTRGRGRTTKECE